MTATLAGVRVDLALPSEWDLEDWLAQADRHPDLWPYGFDHLAAHGVDLHAVGLPPANAARVLRGLARPRHPGRDVWASWDEKRLLRMIADGRSGSARLVSGVIWETEPVQGLAHRVRRALIVAALRRCELVWCLSRPQVGRVRSLIGDRGPRVAHLPFGIDADFFAPSPPRDGGMVVSVGNDLHRDYDLLLEALARVRAERGAVKAVIVTGHDLGALPDGVRVVPRLPHDELAGLYAEAAVVVVPTRPNEHVSGMTAALEAMACARPVVMTATPGVEDYVPAEAGVLVPTGSAQAMAEALTGILGSPAAARSMGRAGRAHVEARHTTRIMMSALADLLAEASASAP